LDGSWNAGGLEGVGTLALTGSAGATDEFNVLARGSIGLGIVTPLLTRRFDAAKFPFSATASGTTGIVPDRAGPGGFRALLIPGESDSTLGQMPFSASSNTFNIAFNTTSTAQPIAPLGVTLPPDLAPLKDPSVIDPFSIRVLIDGTLQLGAISAEGTYLF